MESLSVAFGQWRLAASHRHISPGNGPEKLMRPVFVRFHTPAKPDVLELL